MNIQKVYSLTHTLIDVPCSKKHNEYADIRVIVLLDNRLDYVDLCSKCYKDFLCDGNLDIES